MKDIKTITYRDYLRMEMVANAIAENIPKAHCRIREEEFNRSLINSCKNAKSHTDGKPRYIIVLETYNQGTARYPHTIKRATMYGLGNNPKETEKTFAGYRKANILALVK